jgi:hypothetical protein
MVTCATNSTYNLGGKMHTIRAYCESINNQSQSTMVQQSVSNVIHSVLSFTAMALNRGDMVAV